ncbi:MAG TPA: alpha/beta hydrolase [Acetobacteraceae bacterium]|nr:alpha/beta hydrolase [Acetobacteraceae bacterium]
MMRALIVFFAIAVLLYLAFVGLLYAGQRRLIYVPDRTPPDPARTGIAEIEVLHLHSGDGTPLIAWYMPPAKPDGSVVLYLHGNGGHIGYRGERLRSFRAAGWGALLLEYRGYGGNPGRPTEAGLVLDAEAGLAGLQGLGVPPQRTVLWGESLGSNLAVRLAMTRDFAAVILESPFTSVTALAKALYPCVPVDLLLKDRFETLPRIPAVRSPVLVLQGGRDRLVRPAMSRAVYAAVTARKELWTAPEADHNDLGMFGAVEAAVAFVQKQAGSP